MSAFLKFSLLNYLEKNAPVICDGAKTTYLQKLGFPQSNTCFTANLTHPDLVSQTHKEYLQQGASILRTNTEGANRVILESLELTDQGENINNNSMMLLREGVGMSGILAGSISSIKKEITGDISVRLLEQAYGEQLIFLSDTGAKFIVFSEFEDLQDLIIAVRVAKRSIQKQTIAHFIPPINTSAASLLAMMKEIVQHGADFIGIQAPWDYKDLDLLTKELVDHFGIISVLLNESRPLPIGEVSTGFIKMAQSLLENEIAIIGGGSYTTPAHIHQFKKLASTIFE